MTTQVPKGTRPASIDKEALRRKIEEVNKRLGFEPDPAATARSSREMALALGIRPEDNSFSREIIRLRYEGTEE